MAEVKTTIGKAAALYKVVEYLMFDDQGKDRPMSFALKYKVQKDLNILEKDFRLVEEYRSNLVKSYGSISEDGTMYKVPEDQLEDFKNKISEFISQETSHTLQKLTPEEIDTLSMDALPALEMEMFMQMLVEDPDLPDLSDVIGNQISLAE